MSQSIKPRLRQLDFQPVQHQGEPMWLLRDPWRLSDRQLIFPQALAQMLLFCDGARTPEEIHAAFCTHLGVDVPFQVVIETLAELDNTFLLDNERAERERLKRVAAYRTQPFRPPALAGLSYPESPAELDAYLAQFERAGEQDGRPNWTGRGVVSPHIDYQRGGHVYAQVWRRAEAAVLAADLVLIFGTDHNGRPGSVTLTRQPYATPYGVLPTDAALIDQLAAALGVEAAFAEELNHCHEHSVELSAVWLHHVYRRAGVRPRPMIPILVGSFHHFLQNGDHPAGDPAFNRFLDVWREETRGRRVLAVGSVDLAHVGPAFGDLFVMDQDRRAKLRDEDYRLMNHILNGDATAYFDQIRSVQDRNRICGFAPLYLMLRYLETDGGSMVAYDHCAADANDTSLVSICGLLLD
jgi:AmmeMemoRadiSam system protein B